MCRISSHIVVFSRCVKFQLNIESVEYVRKLLEPWSSSLHEPVQLDIITDDEEQALLERWNIHYLPRSDAKSERMTAISKKMSILLRTLYAYARMVPAFQVRIRLFVLCLLNCLSLF